METTKKHLGQHWLHDNYSLDQICDAARVDVGDVVLEVGPGTGTLTEKLLARGATVVAVELDTDRIYDLQKKFAGRAFSLHQESILSFDLTTLPSSYKVVANIPYYLTSHLLRVFAESPNPPARASLLVQKEVAERVSAGPGKMSLLAVSVQFYFDVSLGAVIPAALFTPPPKVDSQILALVYSGAKFPDVDINKFFQVVKAGFSERRKKLRSSLAGGLRLSKQQAESLLESAGVSHDLRAQELSLDDWLKVYENYDS